MLQFYYNKDYKYTNRKIIDISTNTDYISKDYINIDSPDTINGHIIYELEAGEVVPTYIYDTETTWRWFVSGITQLRTQKYQLSLLRDVISENPQLWSSEEAYISAGLANDYNKYKIWNLPYTNTKVKQERLNFGGKSSFFVFYVNEQELANDSTLSENDLIIKGASIPGIGSANVDFQVSNLNEIPYYSYVNAGDVNLWTNHKANIRLFTRGSNYAQYTQKYMYNFEYNNGSISNGEFVVNGGSSNCLKADFWWKNIDNNTNNCRTSFASAVSNFIDTYENSLGTKITQTEVNSLLNYVNKNIYNSGDSKMYTIRCTSNVTNYNQPLTQVQTGTLTSALRSINFGGYITSVDGSYFTFKDSKTTYNFVLEEIGIASTYDFNFIAGARKLPKSAVKCINIVSDGTILDEDIAQALMQAQLNGTNGITAQPEITTDATAGRIVDIQYLPFSIASAVDSNIKINNTSMISQFLSNDDFTFYTNLPDLTNINKETDTIKIVSPSRASQFLFRPYDNNGNMEFTTRITLKPYTSIIYIRPSTKGLLMNEWDDKDCLIINEDCSLTNITSAWTQYIYNNKNYSNIFERQIQGREFERSWERQIEQAQKQADIWSARNLSSQKARAATGNLPIISSIASAIGNLNADATYMQMAQLDREYNEALYQEGISISRDMFAFQNENLQAQPIIPSKITTIDCKLLDGVYLEFYSTNDAELAAVNNYYKFNGNRIDAYGNFNNYWGWFVRGKIIISQYYTQPEIDELNRRLEMGIFTEVKYD